MSIFPKRSTGVLLSPMADRVIAYDPFRETVHQLNASAGMLLEACDGESKVEDAVRALAEGVEADLDTVAADVSAGLVMLKELGLVGRNEPFAPPVMVVGSTKRPAGESFLGTVHPVLDHNIAFRGTDRRLLNELDEFLGTGVGTGEPTMYFDVHENDDGQLVLISDYEWRFPDLAACLRQLTSVVNEYAVWTHSCAALHSGAVRSPKGEVVLLSAPSGNGKSTLTGAFVAAGWDYLGDEAIGLRPDSLIAVGYPKRLAVGPDSRSVLNLPDSQSSDLDPIEIRPDVVRLHGEVGPTSRVVIPSFEQGAQVKIERLVPHEAVADLLANTLNLDRAGQVALDTVCDLAASVPVDRLVHGDAHQAVARISVSQSGSVV